MDEWVGWDEELNYVAEWGRGVYFIVSFGRLGILGC